MTKVIIIRGNGYGDEGKGTIVDFITSNEKYEVVREGGSQAAHHIVSTDGRLHRSEQIGSGIFNKDVRTFCSKNMIVNPQNLITENLMLHEAKIFDGMKRLSMDGRCTIVTPLHQMIGRLNELANKHGSTGMGIGQAVSDRKNKRYTTLSLQDTTNESRLNDKLHNIFYEKFEQAQVIADKNFMNRELSNLYTYYLNNLSLELLFNSYYNFASAYPKCIENNGDKYLNELIKSDKNIVFEGSQGILIDPDYGFKPNVTKISTTFDTALKLLNNKVSKSEIEKIAVMRAYSTRHGNGAFVTESKILGDIIPDMHNKTNQWQGKFRIGWFDLLATKYGILVNTPDSIALTNLDRLSELNNIFICTSYVYNGKNESLVDQFFEWEYSGNSIVITAFKKPNFVQNEQITNILLNCKPRKFIKFDGWKSNITKVKSFEDLPSAAKKYVNFIQSGEGLNIPISIISVGMTSENKITME